MEEAVKYIIFLVDANQLFDTALGMYDFSLVIMIAQHAQKVSLFSLYFLFFTSLSTTSSLLVEQAFSAMNDLLSFKPRGYLILSNFGAELFLSSQDPREYLPFLRELRALDKYYQRFKIDAHLKRHESALRNLSLAGA